MVRLTQDGTPSRLQPRETGSDIEEPPDRGDTGACFGLQPGQVDVAIPVRDAITQAGRTPHERSTARPTLRRTRSGSTAIRLSAREAGEEPPVHQPRRRLPIPPPDGGERRKSSGEGDGVEHRAKVAGTGPEREVTAVTARPRPPGRGMGEGDAERRGGLTPQCQDGGRLPPTRHDPTARSWSAPGG